jgi:hypothetical protein
MQTLHKKMATICLGNDLPKSNNRLKELYLILLASEPYLGEVSDEYKREIERMIEMSEQVTEILTSEYFQNYMRSNLKAVPGGVNYPNGLIASK